MAISIIGCPSLIELTYDRLKIAVFSDYS